MRNMKRKKRQSTGSTMLSCSLNTLVSNSNEALQLLKSESSVSSQPSASSSISGAMSIINHMVNDGALQKGSELWCFAFALIADEAKREIFVQMEDDDCRKTWLTYLHANK